MPGNIDLRIAEQALGLLTFIADTVELSYEPDSGRPSSIPEATYHQKLRHFLLPSHHQNLYNCAQTDVSHTADRNRQLSPIEIEANTYASELLMPRSFLAQIESNLRCYTTLASRRRSGETRCCRHCLSLLFSTTIAGSLLDQRTDQSVFAVHQKGARHATIGATRLPGRHIKMDSLRRGNLA
ncbi:hypothetical protein K788_00003210 [Paraburkholderia caribensis MBA4]|uniref:Uncharacterized protein n=1 Tax=Paraburkholderia caribensis MBA4 TaxID=1323664 RepID=A0A0P0RHS9_9BURK|nr:hypothetical protein K788_00003210 [Paraburkholderia caribensis MBA4]